MSELEQDEKRKPKKNELQNFFFKNRDKSLKFLYLYINPSLWWGFLLVIKLSKNE